MTDPIADLLIRIKNAHMAKKSQVSMPDSKAKRAILAILLSEGYIESFTVVGEKPKQEIEVVLKYVQKQSAVSGVKRLSKPGRRLYVSAKEIPQTLAGYGLTILSTNKGVLTDSQARQQNVGGELICKIW
ncbi:30S ribosomal protein S8 [Candidatus Woesebacteria bacterium]|nr:30S ribosomal protein S8 [Candidatus Woesebacteria bacterium]